MNIPIADTIIASVLLTVALAILVGILGNLRRRATKGVIGLVKLYETRNLLFFGIVNLLVCFATYTLFPNRILLLIGSLPLLILLVVSIFRRRKNNKNYQVI